METITHNVRRRPVSSVRQDDQHGSPRTVKATGSVTECIMKVSPATFEKVEEEQNMPALETIFNDLDTSTMRQFLVKITENTFTKTFEAAAIYMP